MRVCCGCGDRFPATQVTCPACAHTPPRQQGYLIFAPGLAENSPGFEAKFFSQLAQLEAENFWFRARNRLITWAIASYFPDAQTFLEIGCGTGFVLSGIEQKFPDLKLFGSEIFTAGLDIVEKRSNATLFQMDAHSIPFENEFDLVGAFDVLEHIEADEIVLQQIHQALRPRGGLVLTVPQHPWLWSQADTYAHHVRRYRANELIEKVERAGFEVLKVTSFVSLLLPLMIVSRMRQRGAQVNYNPLSEFQISRWVNRVLERLLDLERWLIQLGLRFPVGGSLLVVARRRSA